MPKPLRLLAALAACTLVIPAAARAQSIEPRSYSNAPVGTSFLIFGFAYTQGGLPTDPAVPLTEPHLDTDNGVVGYARFLDLWGKSAKFDALASYAHLAGDGFFAGAPVSRRISGLGDPAFRLSVNLLGAPALRAQEFGAYHQDVIVGASVQVTAPLGQYDRTRLVNIGMNRWTVKPEIGVSKAIGSWTWEGTVAATWFSDNGDFYGGTRREQALMYSTQGHAIYNFPRGRWASLDVTYFTGGQTTIDDTRKQDLQRNWRVGTTYAFPVSAANSIKLYASRGVSARTGNNFDLLGIALQHRWLARGGAAHR